MKTTNQQYYKVIAKCGHVGRKHYIPIQFAIIAENGKEAAQIARNLPRVKKDHKDAILMCEKISYEVYQEILQNNHNDPYLKCKNHNEQVEKCHLSDRLVIDSPQEVIEYDKEDRLARINYKMNKFLMEIKEELNEYEYLY
jgi:hypothetical protein